MNDSAIAPKDEGRLPYERPVVTELGSVAAVTLGPSGPSFDGGEGSFDDGGF